MKVKNRSTSASNHHTVWMIATTIQRY